MDFGWNLLSPRWWVEYAVEFGTREPAHLAMEIICLGLIVYLVFSSQYKPNEGKPLSRKVRTVTLPVVHSSAFGPLVHRHV
jgi:hypothetical protein